MKIKESRSPTEWVAVFCSILACLSIVFGALMIAFVIANASKPAPDTVSFVLEAIGICFSSIIWFIAARLITLLAQIAHNTRRGEEIMER
jgi:hypothetical protein